MRLRLQALAALFLAAGCGQGTSHQAGAAPAGPPHLLMIVADDLGWGDVGFHGGSIPTPHLDRLAREGVELDRFYAFPSCTPSRLGLMTGRSPFRWGRMWGPLRPWDPAVLPAGTAFLPEILRAAGYETALVGKWHLGQARRADGPLARGFEHFYGFLTGKIDYFAHTNEGGLDWQRDGKSLRERGYATELLAGEAVARIRGRDRGRPLFLCLAFNAPHTPHQPPDGRRAQPYAALVMALDTAIGRVLAALEEEGLAGNTLVLFVSDNGGLIALRDSNGPLPGGKRTVAEGGIRVPAVVRWPGCISAGPPAEGFASVLDVLPTLAAAARAQAPEDLDGRNLLPAWRGEAPSPATSVCFGARAGGMRTAAIIRPPWKLVAEVDPELRVGRTRLFDVWQDPGETRDLSDGQAVLAGELRSLLQARIAAAQDVTLPKQPPGGWRAPADWNTARGP